MTSTSVPNAVSTAPTVGVSTVSGNGDSGVVLHHLQDSRSQRILWLLEEMETPYTIQKYMRVGGLAPPSLMKVHPLGKSPVITANGRTVAESSVIVDYLIRHYRPDFQANSGDEDEQLSVQYWSQMAEGSLMCPLTMKQVFSTVKTATPWLVRPVARAISNTVDSSYLDPTLKAQFDFIEAQLTAQHAKGSEFFVTQHLTAADFMMLFPVEAAFARAAGLLGANTRAWIQRMHQRPAYKRALEKGGEYAFAKM